MGVKIGFTASNPKLPTPPWIPAFAGMTELCKAYPVPRTVVSAGRGHVRPQSKGLSLPTKITQLAAFANVKGPSLEC